MSEWQSIETVPYDKIVIMFNDETGDYSIDFMYDCGPDWFAERGYTYWMPLPEPPND